jgi:hypothetical protein
MNRPGADQALEALETAAGILCLGIGGGGDVAGAIVLSRAIRNFIPEARVCVGGISWERRTVDPLAGPRAICEVSDGQVLNRYAALAGPATSGPDGLAFSESRASAVLGGAPVALVDPGEGTARAADGVVAAARALDCDLVVLVDVGGDALALGHEANLVSPLADAVMLATAPWIEEAGLGVIAGVLGVGCDGELSVAAGRARLAEVEVAAGGGCRLAIPAREVPMLATVARSIGSEATAMVIRCARGERGQVSIRGGKQFADLRADGAMIHLFSARAALEGVARLARTVSPADNIEEGHDLLGELGVRVTGLGYPGARWIAPPGRQAMRAAVA